MCPNVFITFLDKLMKLKFKVTIILLYFFVSLLKAEEYKLDNGLTVILQQNSKVPIVTAQLWNKCGSTTEAEFGGAGISHFIEHLLFTTTKKHSTDEIAKQMKKLGCDMNGYTSFEETVFHFTLSSENLFEVLPLMKEMIFEPAFKKEQIEKEREVILKEINMNIDDPDRFYNNLIFSSVYENSYYKFPIIGFRDIFKKITRDDILNYYNRMYVPENMALIVVGNFNLKETKKRIEQIFGDIPAKRVYPVFKIEEPLQTGYREVKKFRDDITITRMALAFKTVDIRDKDLFSLDVLAIILGRGKASVLNEILKEKEQIVNSISAYSYTPKAKGVFTIEVEVGDNNNINKVKKRIEYILKNIKKYIDKKDIERAKNKVLADYYSSIETIEGMAQDIGINWVSTGNINFSKYYVENIKKVKYNNILSVAKKYFNKNNLTFISLANTKYKKENNVSKKVKSKLEDAVLNNGMKILMNKDTIIPMVTIQMIFKGGLLFEPKGKEGLTYFLSKMILSGTKKYARKKIVETIESKGGSIGTFGGNNSFGITVNIMKKDVKDALKILSDIVENSTFPEEEFKKEKRLLLDEIKQQDEELFNVGKRVMFKTVYGDFPYGEIQTGKIDSIENISREDLINYYKKICVPNNTVLSLSGDVDDKILDLIKENFSGYNNSGDNLNEQKFVIPEEIESREIVTNINKKQTLLLIPFYGIDVRDKDRAKSDILWNILNGQGSRLFTSVREKKHLSYYVGMFPFYGLTTGLFVFYAGTVADKVELAKEEILKEIKELVKRGITEEELEASKKEALSQKLREFQANDSISLNLGLDKLYGIRAETIDEYKKRIDSYTVDDMNRFMRQYFDNDRYYTIIIKGSNK